jgi:hypothetical protein
MLGTEFLHIPPVVLRECGGPSIPEAVEIDREAAAYWVARSSRAMTPVGMRKNNRTTVGSLHPRSSYPQHAVKPAA